MTYMPMIVQHNLNRDRDMENNLVEPRDAVEDNGQLTAEVSGLAEAPDHCEEESHTSHFWTVEKSEATA